VASGFYLILLPVPFGGHRDAAILAKAGIQFPDIAVNLRLTKSTKFCIFFGYFSTNNPMTAGSSKPSVLRGERFINELEVR